jgi:DNA-binding response OmpR family regulator
MRLLLVEPDPRVAQRLRVTLESDGYVVDHVGTLEEAERVADRPYAITVVMDPIETVTTTTTTDAGPPTDAELWFG